MLLPWLEPYFQQFVQAMQQGRLAGSVIIAGHNGLGANELAFEVAKYYLCHQPGVQGACNTCRSCLSFNRYIHQDLKVAYISTTEEANSDEDFSFDASGLFYPKEASARCTLRVDTMRKVTEYLLESSVGGHGKVVIISGAETMNESAANAILKTFEEPRPGTLIIMVTQRLESLLPTILSRAFKMVLREVSEQVALDYILDPKNQRPRVLERDANQSDAKEEQADILKKCEGLKTAIDLKRAEIALALTAQAPLKAMDLILKGDDLKALAVVEFIVKSIASKQTSFGDGELISTLGSLSKSLQARLLSELILELLKYKAHIAEDKLPLIKYAKAQPLHKLKADHLFMAYDQMRYLEDRAPLIPSRAPQALVRAWIKALKGEKLTLSGK